MFFVFFICSLKDCFSISMPAFWGKITLIKFTNFNSLANLNVSFT